VPCECLFSTTGEVVVKNCLHLTGKHSNDFLFLNNSSARMQVKQGSHLLVSG
jgi:hypothetical protein